MVFDPLVSKPSTQRVAPVINPQAGPFKNLIEQAEQTDKTHHNGTPPANDQSEPADHRKECTNQ